MGTVFEGLSDGQLMRWVEQCVLRRGRMLARGYQGNVYFCNENGHRLAIKEASGRGPMRWLRCRMLRNEFMAYSRLAGIEGCPHCYALIGGRYLVLEYLEGEPLQRAEVVDRAKYYGELFCLIDELHRRGVAHFDLKRKHNLMVLPDSSPAIVDFGVAVCRKRGFAPVNHFFYDLAVKIDFNAWVKHKYRGCYGEVSVADRFYFQNTRAETLVRVLRRVSHAFRAVLPGRRSRSAVHRPVMLRGEAAGAPERQDATKPVPQEV